MSVNSLSSNTPFNFDGIVSNLSTSSIITKMMSLEQAPLTQLQKQQATVKSRDDAYQALQTQVSSFQSALKTLLLSSNVNVKSTTSSSASVATATAGSDAVNGSYTVGVTRLATTSAIASQVWDATANAGAGAWQSAPVGAGLDSGAAGTNTSFKNAGFAIPPTAGTFTINGQQIDISDTVDAGNPHTLDWVVQQINNKTGLTSVTASITTDANGHKNGIKLSASNGSPIQLGSGADTSNFLAAAHLVAIGAVGDLVSSVPLGTANTSATLANAHLATPLNGTGTFHINGAQISWDASQDSINTIIAKINGSAAGVTASYDATRDALSLTNVATGNQSISLTDDSGGFLAAMHLTGANQQTLGTTAQFSINGGANQYSNSNSVAGIVPGVSFNLAGVGSTTIAVNQDTTTTVNNVQSFVTSFNALVDLIDKDTKYNAANKQASVLTGDFGVQSLENQLRGFLSNSAPNAQGTYTTLGSLGISTGAYGSAVGTTNHLTVDTAKLTAALQADPKAVFNVLAGDARVTINPDSAGKARSGAWISSVVGTPGGSYGRYAVTVDSTGALTSVFTPVGLPPLKASTGAIAVPPPSSTNATLIGGLTINTTGLPGSGTATDTLWYGQSGILGQLNDFLSTTLGAGGLFDNEHTSATSQQTALGHQIDDTKAQLDQRQQALQARFTAMEVALSQINSQGGQLLSSLGVSSTK